MYWLLLGLGFTFRGVSVWFSIRVMVREWVRVMVWVMVSVSDKVTIWGLG